MNAFVYGTYILVWPAITLAVLVLICGAVVKDVRDARKSKRDVI
ncbi:putative transporter small subunit [Marinobacter sp. X15-166B]|nr:putative transporter small subunit [Marinobacter sp. X15-166B]